jgi:hypothetical protein
MQPLNPMPFWRYAHKNMAYETELPVKPNLLFLLFSF